MTPFPQDKDRAEIWQMLVERDIAAFVAADWGMVADDFVRDGFFGVHAHKSASPDDWKMGFPTLADYRDEWLRQAQASAALQYAEPLAAGIHRATDLSRIEVNGPTAIAHKKFDGTIRLADGSVDTLNWQTMYFCRIEGGKWKIAGFVGYMAYR